MTIETYKTWFVDTPTYKRQAKFISIFVLRTAESEVILRTDGEINNELTVAGLTRRDMPNDFYRIFFSKRKESSPERRTGRADLRSRDLLKNRVKDGVDCEINKTMCGKCIDCRLYGSAVGSEVSLQSHVITEEGFSLLHHKDCTDEHTFNATYENGTMKDPVTGKTAQALGSDEVIRIGTQFLSIETLSDITINEFIYIVGNILRTKRYGAQVTRLGKMNNTVIGIVLSDCELPSNLEWTQRTYDLVCQKLNVPENKVPSSPIESSVIIECAQKAIVEMVSSISGSTKILNATELQDVLQQVKAVYDDSTRLTSLLTKIDDAQTKADLMSEDQSSDVPPTV